MDFSNFTRQTGYVACSVEVARVIVKRIVSRDGYFLKDKKHLSAGGFQHF